MQILFTNLFQYLWALLPQNTKNMAKFKENRGRPSTFKPPYRVGDTVKYPFSKGIRATAHSWARRNNRKFKTWEDEGQLVVLRVR